MVNFNFTLFLHLQFEITYNISIKKKLKVIMVYTVCMEDNRNARLLNDFSVLD